MPEPLSTTIAIGWFSYAAAQGLARKTSAVSPEAQVVRDAVTAVVGWAEQSQALFGHKATAISALRALANECADPGWDGENADGLNAAAVAQAENLIRAMPDALPLPEIAPEPDGSISLDWLQARHRLFSLSIGPSDRLAFAWLDGSDRGHGVARFDGQQIPTKVLQGIQSITGHAPIRVA